MDLNEAAVFVKVVQAGSFSAAARSLSLPTSTVSTRISRLEKRLGVTLLQRTTRRLNLTEAGTIYFGHASIGLSHMLEAEAAISESAGEAQGLLRVTAPADIGNNILAKVLNEMRQTNPKVKVDLVLTSHYADLIAEGIDIAIRTGPLQDSSLIARKIGIIQWALFAAPDYLTASPIITEPKQLNEHPCLQFTPMGKDHWTLFSEKENLIIPMTGNVLINDIGVILSMTLSGKGVALLPTYLHHNEYNNNQLVRILPDWNAKTDTLNLVYPKQRFVPPKLRAFIDIASENFKSYLSEAN